MPLKTFKTREEAPADQREKLMELKDGSFVFDEPVDAAALKAEGQRALDAERTRAETEEKERKRLAKELADLKRDQAALDKGTTKEEIERLRKEDADARKPLEDKIAALEKENRTIKLDDKIRRIALDKGVMKTRIDAAMKLTADRFELTADGNGIIVKGPDGKSTTESVEDYWEKTGKNEMAFVYEGVNASGSGAEGSNTGGGAGGGYDPVAAGKALAAGQKKSAASNADAFR